MIGRTVEGRVCQSPSQKFHGLCLINHNCYVVCQSEGFSSGECDGIRRRCMCTRLCWLFYVTILFFLLNKTVTTNICHIYSDMEINSRESSNTKWYGISSKDLMPNDKEITTRGVRFGWPCWSNISRQEHLFEIWITPQVWSIMSSLNDSCW